MNNKRVLFLIVGVFIFFLAIGVKLFSIQILKSEELKYLAERQQTESEKISSQRGLIFDRNNVLLVYNRNDVSFYLDMRMVSKDAKKKIAQKFSIVFGKPVDYYSDQMNISGKTICIEKKAPSEKAIVLKNLKIAGLFYKEDPTRIYHYNNLASHVLGYISNDFHGVNGIEKIYDDQLKGVNGEMYIEKNAIGDMITVAEEQTKAAIPGNNIVLTINKSYQVILEEELKKGLENFGGTSALGIIMDPNNGEILAMSDQKDFNPNLFWEYSDTLRRNKVLTDTYEPGSTFKTITMSALLDQKLCRDDETINIEHGRYRFNNVYINDSHNGTNTLTVRGILEQSSNVGISKLVQRIDDELYYKYIRAFGFGNFSSVDLPGEAEGSLKKPTGWTPITKAFISFGYELSVTPIQLISAYAAVINGGILYQPQIISRIMDPQGVILNESAPKPIRNVISKETSSRMREYLRGVVEKGTGKSAKLDFISVGGKTGTSQKLVDGKYSKSHYNSSFIGFFPVENPQILCLILVNSPERGKYGGTVAAPIFKEVADKIFKSNTKFFMSNQKIKQEKPEIINHSFTNNNSDSKITPVSNNTYKKIDNSYAIQNNLMPDLSNYSLRDALLFLSKVGLKYKVSGSGTVVSQSIAPGSKIQKGIICSISCDGSKIKGAVIY
jgi:cell division protein FtsI (penicillin-binding protein 3)